MILRHASVEIGIGPVPGAVLIRNDDDEINVPVASVPALIGALMAEAGPYCAAAARAVERAAARASENVNR